MLKTIIAVMGVSVGFVFLCVGCKNNWEALDDKSMDIQLARGIRAVDILSQHPASQPLVTLFREPFSKPPRSFKSTGITSDDYLTLVAGNVDFYKQYLNEAGAIIDPVKHEEIQYSTPSFALAAATLVAQKNRQDLLEPSVRAMSFATRALANKTTANFHADFYIPMLIHTRRILAPRVSKQTLATWDDQLRSIIPENIYRDIHAGGNWNLVQLDGENMRRKDGLVATSQATSQPAYVEKSLDAQEKRFTKFGMYADPNMPLAYDAFPRLWMEDMMADGAYQGPHAQQIRDFLLLGGLSSLLMISPNGEWACGGRSAFHQWNEAENIVIFEINARKWHQLGRDDIAGAMKRSAHLAYESMKRWQRPSGELWIVKNRAEPDSRLGYEPYSSHSQYNLLPMAMLCIAHERADDSIKERPAPCEVGGFVFDVREKFHKVFANAGGMYLEIDTAADPHYNATGLQRVMKKGVPISPLSDSTAAHRAFGPTTDRTMIAMSPGIQWAVSNPAATQPAWESLADFVQPVEPKPAKGDRGVESADLQVTDQLPARVAFAITYKLGETSVKETYAVTPDRVDGQWEVLGAKPAPTRVLFPVLVNDGAKDLNVRIGGAIVESGPEDGMRPGIEAHRDGGVLRWQLVSPTNVSLKLQGPSVVNHNGYARAVIGDLPDATTSVRWRLTLEHAGK